jgi:acylphosphatase
MKRLIAHVSGDIKGVGYSGIVETLARTLDIKGYIENLPDGRAFIIAEGPKEDLARFVKAIRIDWVKEILIDYREPTGEFSNFYKIDHLQEKRIHPDKNASETAIFNFLQSPQKMDRLVQEMCTPNHELKKAGSDLERQEESAKLCKEETLVPESCKPLPRVERKLSLNK